MPGGICEKSRREELLKTKNEEHMSDWSFLFVSGRCCVSLVVSYLSFKVMPHIRTLLGASSSLVLPMGMTCQKSQAAGTTYRAHKLACGTANAASGSSYYNNVPTNTQSISASAFAASYNSHRTSNRAYRLAKVRKSDLRLALALCAHTLLDDVSQSSTQVHCNIVAPSIDAL